MGHCAAGKFRVMGLDGLIQVLRQKAMRQGIRVIVKVRHLDFLVGSCYRRG